MSSSLAAGDDDGGHRRAHARELGVARRPLEHGVVGARDRVVHAPARWPRRRGAPRSRSGSRPRRRGGRPCRRRPRRAGAPSSTRSASSLLPRTRPVSVDAPAASFIVSDLEHGLADLHRVALARPSIGSCTCLPFTNVPLRRAEVFDPSVPSRSRRARVHLRHERVERERHRAAAAATDRGLAVDPYGRARFGRRARRTTSRHLRASPGRRGAAAAAGDGSGGPVRACRAARAPTTHTTRARNRYSSASRQNFRTVRTGSDIVPLRLLVAEGGCTDRRSRRRRRASCSCTTTPLTSRAVSRAEVDDAEAVVVAADLGVVARHLRVGERDRAVGQAADRPRLLAELHPAAVGRARARRSVPPSARRRSRRRPARSPTLAAFGRRRSATSTGPTKWYFSSRACSRAVSASSSTSASVEAGEPLEVLVREAQTVKSVRARRCRARRACARRPSRARDGDRSRRAAGRCGTPC